MCFWCTGENCWCGGLYFCGGRSGLLCLLCFQGGVCVVCMC